MQHIYNGKTRVWLFECVCVLLYIHDYIHDNYYFYSRGAPDLFITHMYVFLKKYNNFTVYFTMTTKHNWDNMGTHILIYF
jgi:hypothetical protein